MGEEKNAFFLHLSMEKPAGSLTTSVSDWVQRKLICPMGAAVALGKSSVFQTITLTF